MIEIKRFNLITPLTKWAIEELNNDGVIDVEDEMEGITSIYEGIGHSFSIINEEPLNDSKYSDKINYKKWNKVEDIKENRENLIALTNGGFVFNASYKDGIWYKVNEKKEKKPYKNSKNITGWMSI